MKKLTKAEFYSELKRLEETARTPHKDYETNISLASLWYSVSDGYFWELPKLIYRSYKVKEVNNLHAKCCDLDLL